MHLGNTENKLLMLFRAQKKCFDILFNIKNYGSWHNNILDIVKQIMIIKKKQHKNKYVEK